MPRYLSRNYFKLHARELEELLDRCLLVSPGEHFTATCQLSLTEDLYKARELRDKDILDKTVSEDMDIGEELRRLCAAVPMVESVGECDKDRYLWDLSYEMEITDSGYFSQEVFYTDDTYVYNDWVPATEYTNELVGSYFFEEMETCDLLSLEPERYYPSIDRLVGRWKSKPVTDPLLGGDGQPLLTEVTFLREDMSLGIELGVSNGVIEEQFCSELIGDEEVLTTNGVISLLEEPCVPGTHSIPIDYLELALLSNTDMSPLSDLTDDKIKSDLSNLDAQGVNQLIFQLENQLEISLTEGGAEEINEIPTRYQEDPLWVLESPLVPDRTGPGLLTQLTTDHPLLPLTPLTPRQFLSPGAVRKYESALRSTNHMPDEISNMMLLEPDARGAQSYPPVQDILEQMEMKPDDNLSSLEMELRWDPLTPFYAQIEQVNHALARQSSLELKLSSSDSRAEENVRVLIQRENQLEDLIKYDTLLPQLERESLDSSVYSLSSAARLNCSETRDDGITLKPKVQIKDHTAQPGMRVRIPEICTSHQRSLPLTIDKTLTKTSESFNQIDSIDSFLMLRQKRQSPQASTNASPEQTQPSAQAKRICTLSTPKQASKLIMQDVPLNKLYREALDLLTTAGEPLLRRIQEYGYLQEASFISLVKCPEILQFLLREHKHQWLEQDMPTESAIWYKLKTICQLFCLVSSGSALLGTSLSAAIDVLFGSVNKYKVLVQDSLVTTGNSLVGMREQAQNSFHPKIIQTISILLEKENTLTKLFNVCIIVFDIECTFNLAGEMLEILKSQVGNSCINLIKAPCNETYSSYHEVLLRAFDISHCLLCESSTLNHDSFPWKRISLMILYNLKDISRSVALINEKTHEDCRIHVLKASMESDLNTSQSEIAELESQKSSFMICSTEISEEQGLLELIETRCNLYVVERDYIAMGLSGYSADLIVNESTGILLVNLTRLAWEGELLAITVEKLHNLQVSYSTCYVLAYTRSTEEYLSGEGPRMLAALNSAISELRDGECRFELRGSTEIQGVTDLIRTIASEHSSSNCQASEVEIEASEQEKWLLSLKCINSYSALSLLSKYDLRELVRLDLSQLKQEQQEIPVQCLAALHQICNQNLEHWSNSKEKDYRNSGSSELLKYTVNSHYPMSYTIDKSGSIHGNVSDVSSQYSLRNNNRMQTSSSNNNIVEVRKESHQVHRKTNSEGVSKLYQTENHTYRSNNTYSIQASREKTGSFTEGLLAFQKLEAVPIERMNSIEQKRSAFNNQLYTTDNRDWVEDETMDLRQEWSNRELGCKQVPGLSQTKLIFK